MKAIVEAQLYRDAADVQRYHTKRTLRAQTVGQHTFNMLLLVNLVAPACRKEVMLAVMKHDLPELMTGDIPAPIKRMHDTLGPLMDEIEQGLAPLYEDYGLTPDESRLVKWADRMELVMWCLEEFRMGNTFMRSTAETGMQWILEAAKFLADNEAVDNLTSQVVADMLSLGMTINVRPFNERQEA